jgi:hypothetical protein
MNNTAPSKIIETTGYYNGLSQKKVNGSLQFYAADNDVSP